MAKITSQPAATSLDESEFFPLVQGGVNKKATLGLMRLIPSTGTTGEPTTGTGVVGMVRMDTLGGLWACTVAGSPGTWRSATRPWFDVKQYGAKGNGTTDDTTAIQNAINAALTATGGIVYFPHGKYKITDTLSITNAGGLTLLGTGGGLEDGGHGYGTAIIATTSMAGKAMIKFTDSRDCVVRGFNIHGVAGGVASTPQYGIQSHAAGVNPSTNLTVEDCFFGGGSARTLFEGVSYTFDVGHDSNNDVGTIRNCVFYYIEKPIYYRGANCLVHHIENVRWANCKTGVVLEGGSFTMSNCSTGNGTWPWYDGGVGCFIDFKAIPAGGGARYTHRSQISNLISEGSGNPMIRSSSDATCDNLNLVVTNSELIGSGESTGQVLIDWNATNSHLSFVNCYLDQGQPSITGTFGATTSNVSFTNCKFGTMTFTYYGTVTVTGGYVPAGTVFTPSGTSAKITMLASSRTTNLVNRDLTVGDTTGNNDSYIRIAHKKSGNGGLKFVTEDGERWQIYMSGNDVLYVRDLVNGVQHITMGTGVAGAGVTWVDGELQGGYLRVGPTGGTGPTIRQGTGSPESVVTATVGSLFLRTDGGAGTSLYVKESGSGNTGWVAK